MESITRTSAFVRLARCLVLAGLVTINVTGCTWVGTAVAQIDDADIPEPLSWESGSSVWQFMPVFEYDLTTDYATLHFLAPPAPDLARLSLLEVQQQTCSSTRQVKKLATMMKHIPVYNRHLAWVGRAQPKPKYFTTQTIRLPAGRPINLQVEFKTFVDRTVAGDLFCARAHTLTLESGRIYELRVDTSWNPYSGDSGGNYRCDFTVNEVDYSGSDETKKRSRIVERVHLKRVDLPYC